LLARVAQAEWQDDFGVINGGSGSGVSVADIAEGLIRHWDSKTVVRFSGVARPGDPTMLGGPVSTALGEGVAPIEEVIEILDRNGFDGPVCVELASLGSGPVDELAMIERSMHWLRTHIPVAAG